MEISRQSLEETAKALLELNTDDLVRAMEMRFQRFPSPPLPPIARDEDPADILIDTFQWLKESRGKDFDTLLKACETLIDQWSQLDDLILQRYAEPLGEACYLCARIGATATVPSIAKVAARDALATTVLPGGEDLQNRALRSLAGLLTRLQAKERGDYRSTFEKALDSEHHAPIALASLSVFWPEERSKFIERANKYENEHVKWAIENLDLIEKTWPTI